MNIEKLRELVSRGIVESINGVTADLLLDECDRLSTEGALKDAVIEAARTTVHEDDSYYNVTHELEDALIAFDAVSSTQEYPIKHPNADNVPSKADSKQWAGVVDALDERYARTVEKALEIKRLTAALESTECTCLSFHGGECDRCKALSATKEKDNG